MTITEDLLKQNGLHLSTLTNHVQTYVNDDYSIRIWKAKTLDGWFVAIHNNYGFPVPEDPFAETVGKLFSGYCTEMEGINLGLAACEFKPFKF